MLRAAGMLAICVLVGCGAMPRPDAVPDALNQSREATERRSQFETDRSAQSIRWLLANAVRQGMTVDDVNDAIGTKGRRVVNDHWIKSGNLVYRQGDETYEWGPDRDGNSYYLVFREDKLVSFDPGEFL